MFVRKVFAHGRAQVAIMRLHFQLLRLVESEVLPRVVEDAGEGDYYKVKSGCIFGISPFVEVLPFQQAVCLPSSPYSAWLINH